MSQSPPYLAGEPNQHVFLAIDCNRTVCGKPVPVELACWHPHNHAFYCADCARAVNAACNELVILSPGMPGWKSPQEWWGLKA